MPKYYDIVVNTARMIGDARATKVEIEAIAKRMFVYVNRKFDKGEFNKAFADFRRCETKFFRQTALTN